MQTAEILNYIRFDDKEKLEKLEGELDSHSKDLSSIDEIGLECKIADYKSS